MTALAGVWRYGGASASRGDPGGDVARMLSAQAMYGRDASDRIADGDVALGRCLMRRLPEDRYDRQPLDDGRFLLIADVRLDDRAGLGDLLGIAASEAATLADAEFVLRAWARWGERTFDHLYGDYAFALWDRTAQALILARDALGAKPLHYHLGEGFVAVASMPKGLHALADVPYGVDEVRAAELLSLVSEVGPRSFFAGVSRVQVGEVVTITRGGVSARRHWQPSRETIRHVPGTDYAWQLAAHLDRAVAARLRGAGAEVGAHLSAGFDSSAVAATAARVRAITGQRVTAFTAAAREGYDGPAPPKRDGHEEVLAAATAALHANIDHVVVRTGERTVLDNLDRDFALFDRPHVNVCNLRWWTAIDEEAQRRGITVMLTAVAGNQTISYDGDDFLTELAAQGRWWRFLREGARSVKTKRIRWRGVMARAIGPRLPGWAWLAVHRLFGMAPPDIHAMSAIRPEHFAELGMRARAAEAGTDLSFRPRTSPYEVRVSAFERFDFANFNKGMLAGWGVDMRDPTADRALVEFCLSLPIEAFREGGMARALAMKAFADRVPQAVLASRRKGYQAIDWHEGLTQSRDELRAEVERLANVPEAAKALDLPRMRALIEDWPEDGWETMERRYLYRRLLLRGTAVGHFIRKASGSNA